MASRIKSILTAGVFLGLLFGGAALLLFGPDRDFSPAERRALAQKPAVSAGALLSGTYMSRLEKYYADQMPLRDGWRRINALLRRRVFLQSDVNGIYTVDAGLYKIDWPLKENQLLYAVNGINDIAKRLEGSGCRTRFAIIPDKNYFAAEKNSFPSLDYERLVWLAREHCLVEYADIFPLLELGDYYKTDTHWRQESLVPTAQALADAFEPGVSLTPEAGFEQHRLAPFLGVYAGQSALNVAGEDLIYLTSAAIDAAVMTGMEIKTPQGVYSPEGFYSLDPYNIFAGGAQPLINLSSPLAKTDRSLVIFRDSFGSAIAPLFLEGYAEVTLVDLRYIPTEMVFENVDFSGQDVLFLYSTSLLNAGMLLR